MSGTRQQSPFCPSTLDGYIWSNPYPAIVVDGDGYVWFGDRRGVTLTTSSLGLVMYRQSAVLCSPEAYFVSRICCH